MNSKTTIIGLVAAIAVLSGAMGLSVTGAFSDQTIAQSTIPATGLLMGQVMIEAHNENGELIAYRLGDNEVVDRGEQCILKMLFATDADGSDGNRGGTVGTSVCTGALTGAWSVIAIGVGTTGHGDTPCASQAAPSLCDTATHDAMSGLEKECSANDGSANNDCGLQSGKLSRATATTKSWANGSGIGATQITLAKTFTAGASATITESGLFNSTTIDSGGMLSHKTFAAVSLTDGDSITVTWTFRVGN